MTTELEETRTVLLEMARRRFGKVPVEAIVAHVLEMTSGADFAVRRAAMDALVRRMTFAVRDRLTVVTRPARGAILGEYTTARAEAVAGGKAARSERRPYATLLESVAPLRGSCDCTDFVRSSLGLCKHLLVVLDAVHRSQSQATTGTRVAKATSSSVVPARLTWSPVLPLRGPLDRAVGLRLDLGGDAASRVPLAVRRCVDPVRLGSSSRSRALDTLHAAITGPRPALDATPAARRIVAEERALAARRDHYGAHLSRSLQQLTSLQRKLYRYQREGVTRFLQRGRLLLADDMGLGKTTQAIAACHALFFARRITKGLVIAPASLKPQWLREWQETTSVPITVVDGTPEERKRIYRQHRSGFLVIGYEQLLRDIAHVHALAPEMVVVDEAQRIKNYATKSAEYVKALDPEYRLVLTGTPMENRLEELASILDWVDDVALAPKWRLVPWHTRTDGDGDRGTTGARNLDTLRVRIGDCVLRRLRRDVLAQLPSRTDTRVPVEMTAQQREAHDDLSAPIAVLASKAKKRPLTQPEFLRMMSLLNQQRIISNGLAQERFESVWPTCVARSADPAVLEGLFAPKLSELRRLVADLVIGQGRKVVVFSQWRRMLRLAEWSVRDVLAAEGYRAVFFTGAEKTAQRTRAIVDLHDDPNVRIMFLSDAGGVGLNLQRAASACINLEMPWNPAVLEQRVGRIHRLGQKKPIDVYNLVSEYGIESRISSLVGMKQALFTSVFDGTTDDVQFDAAGSFASRVEKLVDPMALEQAPERAALTRAELSDDDGTEDESVSAATPAAPPETSVDASTPSRTTPAIGDVMASIRIERMETGSLRIEAPPEAAHVMATAFEMMAKLMRAASAAAPSAGQ